MGRDQHQHDVHDDRHPTGISKQCDSALKFDGGMLRLAQAQVELAGAHSGARKIVFLMSDGVNSNGDAAAINQATVLKNAGFELYVAGFGGARQVP